MAKVHKVDLPNESALGTFLKPGDFLDCYQVKATVPPRQAAEIITTFPVWASWLLRLRNLIVAPFGLSTDGPDAVDKIGPFPVELETGTELIAGFNDTHLDFRVSVRAEDGQLTLATWVRRHNLGGRIYLAVIMPFHILIARNALKRVARSV